jgi:DNA-binding transcriptional ArsR family regulator
MPAVRRDVFQGIADPTRRAILTMITEEPKNLNTIAENFDVSRPAISQHIKILKECGLVMIRKEGRERYCEPKLETLAEVADWIEPFKKIWESRFNQLDHLLEELKAKQKEK